MNPDADIIVVFGGTNDYGYGDAEFGEMTDKTPDTFCGAVDFLMTFLKENYAGKEIVFLTPARRAGDLEKSSDILKKPDAKPLKDYVDVIVNKGKQHNIHTLNMYDEFKINPNNEEDKLKYTTDGLHFNNEAHKLMADCIIDFLKKYNNLLTFFGFKHMLYWRYLVWKKERCQKMQLQKYVEATAIPI